MDLMISQNKLAFLLRDFDIKPALIRFPVIGPKRGYHWSELDDAFARYLPAQNQAGEQAAVTPCNTLETVSSASVETAVGGPALAETALECYSSLHTSANSDSSSTKEPS